MKNKMIDLNNYLFEQIEKINDDSLSAEDLDKTIKQATAIKDIAETIVKSNELTLKATSMALNYGYVSKDDAPTLLLEGINGAIK